MKSLWDLPWVANREPYRYKGVTPKLPPVKWSDSQMSMSRDRVKFLIPSHRLSSSCHAREYRKLLKEVFNLEASVQGWQDMQIICRPSQFARFLIRRHEMGMLNMFSELNAELFTPCEQKTPQVVVCDVSGNRNECRS